MSARAVAAAVVAGVVVAAAGWGVGNVTTSGAKAGGADAPPESFTPSTERVEIGTLAHRRDLPKLARTPAKSPSKKKPASSSAPAGSTAPAPAAPPPPPPVRPRVVVPPPPPPPPGTPGGDFSTGGTT